MKKINLLIGSLTLLFSAHALAVQTITVYDGSSAAPAPNPMHANVKIDSANRAHVVWAHINDENGSQRYNVFYQLIAADGSVLINTTQLSSATDDAAKSFKPQIAIDGTDTVYVAWHQDSDDIRLLGIDPSADDLDGDAATLATIQRFAEITDFTSADTGGTSTSHVYIDTDSTGKVHVLVDERSSNDDLYCAVYNADGSVSKSLAMVVAGGDTDYGTSSINITLDSNDKMHIAMVTEGANGNEAAYAMVDCAAGSTLIDTTIVSTDDTTPSMQTSLGLIDDKVYINWIDTPDGDASCANGSSCNNGVNGGMNNIMRFIGLNPAQDNQDGSAATLASITTVATQSIDLSNVSPAAIWYPRMGVTEKNNLQVLFYSSNDPDQLFTVDVDTNGGIVSPAAEVYNDTTTSDNTSSTKANMDDRASVYTKGQTVQMVLRGSAGDPTAEEVASMFNFKFNRSGSGTSSWGIFSLMLLILPIGLRFARKRS